MNVEIFLNFNIENLNVHVHFITFNLEEKLLIFEIRSTSKFTNFVDSK